MSMTCFIPILAAFLFGLGIGLLLPHIPRMWRRLWWRQDWHSLRRLGQQESRWRGKTIKSIEDEDP
jgi:hypothetical protein